MIYVGVDVGADGGVAAVDEMGSIIYKSGIPRVKGTTDVCYKSLSNIFMELKLMATGRSGGSLKVVVEDVHSLFGMSAGSNFNFGHIKGVKEGMLTMEKIPYELVQPKVWQKVMWKPEDVVLKENKRTKDTKATSAKAAIRLWPEYDFRKTERSRKPHDGIIDAALMAEYCRIIEQDGRKKA